MRASRAGFLGTALGTAPLAAIAGAMSASLDASSATKTPSKPSPSLETNFVNEIVSRG